MAAGIIRSVSCMCPPSLLMIKCRRKKKKNQQLFPRRDLTFEFIFLLLREATRTPYLVVLYTRTFSHAETIFHLLANTGQRRVLPLSLSLWVVLAVAVLGVLRGWILSNSDIFPNIPQGVLGLAFPFIGHIGHSEAIMETERHGSNVPTGRLTEPAVETVFDASR